MVAAIVARDGTWEKSTERSWEDEGEGTGANYSATLTLFTARFGGVQCFAEERLPATRVFLHGAWGARAFRW